MTEVNMLWYIPLSTLLFALGGGLKWDIPGIKLLRNPGVGILTGLYLLAQGMLILPAIIHGVGQFVANKIAPSYGSKNAQKFGKWIWLLRWFTFTIWLIPTLWIHFTWMIVFAPPIMLGFMWMSQKGQPEAFVHKPWEMLCGFCISTTYVTAWSAL